MKQARGDAPYMAALLAVYWDVVIYCPAFLIQELQAHMAIVDMRNVVVRPLISIGLSGRAGLWAARTYPYLPKERTDHP